MPPDHSTRILFVGDMHLGRRPTGLPEGLDPAPFRPAAALRQVVKTARDLEVHAVAFAGDLVDGDNDLFEAYTPLAEAAGGLLDQGIAVAAVAGNHDTDVLPRLAQNLGGKLQLLGPRGTWSDCLVEGNAPLPVRLVGWSFPARHWEDSPLAVPPPPARPGELTLGLLHGDLEDPRSRFAPVARDRLLTAAYQGWFLGHIHRPDPVSPSGPPVMYLGSLTPLDPSETGMHGPVLVTADDSGAISARRLPLAPLRWEHLDMPCPSFADPAAELADHILGDLLGRVRTEELPDTLAGIGYRLTLTGRVDHPERLRQAAAHLRDTMDPLGEGRLQLFVEDIRCRVTRDHDLDALALRDDPAGLLARTITDLRDDPQGERAAALLAAAREAASRRSDQSEYTLLPPDRRQADPEMLREILIRQAFRLLDTLTGPAGGEHGTA